jgi:NDP-sugar pyrophosphorylase family protein
MLPVAILAGGLATRLRPLTETIPKSLVEVAGEPFAFHQLRLLARHEFRRVVFLLGYLGEQVRDAVGDGSGFGLEVDYVFDGETLLGTGGALARAVPALGPQFAVVYGDSYLDCDYRAAIAAFTQSGMPALMTVFKNEGRWDTSNVEFSAGRILAYSKAHRNERMRHIDYGLGVLRADALSGVSRDTPSDLAEVYEALAAGARLAAFEVNERFYEVGSFSGIKELEQKLEKEIVN